MSQRWELVEVTNSSCDECGNPAACNVYRTEGCRCNKCKDKRSFLYFHVCGYCTDKWLKSKNQFVEED